MAKEIDHLMHVQFTSNTFARYSSDLGCVDCCVLFRCITITVQLGAIVRGIPMETIGTVQQCLGRQLYSTISIQLYLQIVGRYQDLAID